MCMECHAALRPDVPIARTPYSRWCSSQKPDTNHCTIRENPAKTLSHEPLHASREYQIGDVG